MTGTLPQGHSVSEVSVPEAGEAGTVNRQGGPTRRGRGAAAQWAGRPGPAPRVRATSLGAPMSSDDDVRQEAAVTQA